ncbi:MAG TPA: outer membrane lipoprotein chaperone LolA [Woeseiaceae bacterium]|nr:outer membrane lipoprotein chaperone LolA [Woeseiaceae bacterium]
METSLRTLSLRVAPALVAGGLLCLSGAAATGAERAAETAAGRALVEQFVTEVRTMSGRFEQKLVSEENEVVESSSGTFRIMRPGRFRWSYSEPYEQLLVADGTNVWSYDVDLEQVTVKPQAEVLGSTPASLLGGSTEVLENFEVTDSSTDRGTVWVSLQPTDGDSGFETIELGFTDGVLTRMILSDELAQTTLVALHDVEINEKIDPAQFEFSPPEGVDVVGRPAVPSASTP